MIGIVIRELTFLKVMTPIIRELHKLGNEYILFHMLSPRPGKDYVCPKLERIIKSARDIVENAQKVISFTNDDQLMKQLIANKVDKFVSVEIWLCNKRIPEKLRGNGIRSYSIQYLTDSIWQPAQSITSVDRIYYISEYVMKMHQKFSGAKFNPNRDRCLGSPIFDSIRPNKGDGDILVLTPNIRGSHVNFVFGSSKNFVKIIEKLSRAGNLIFKTRKKQWLPEEVKKYAKEIVHDGEIMYPSSSVDLFNRCHSTVLFYSSGIYEAVCSNNYVFNITIPLKFFRWDKAHKNQYLAQEGGLYRFPGVSESIEQNTILSDSWKFTPHKIDKDKREKWLEKFVGNLPSNSSELIARDITNG